MLPPQFGRRAAGKPVAAVLFVKPREFGSNGDDTAGVEVPVTRVVVAFDVIELTSLPDAG
jgi:hypothetical protein